MLYCQIHPTHKSVSSPAFTLFPLMVVFSVAVHSHNALRCVLTEPLLCPAALTRPWTDSPWSGSTKTKCFLWGSRHRKGQPLHVLFMVQAWTPRELDTEVLMLHELAALRRLGPAVKTPVRFYYLIKTVVVNILPWNNIFKIMVSTEASFIHILWRVSPPDFLPTCVRPFSTRQENVFRFLFRYFWWFY